jgi:ABC-type Fe3+ transport system substrate-binding protein
MGIAELVLSTVEGLQPCYAAEVNDMDKNYRSIAAERRGIMLAKMKLWSMVAVCPILAGNALGAAPSSAIDKAKQESEARGYLFIDSRDKLVAGAKKEGKLRALSGLDADTIKAMTAAFKKKYPFLDVQIDEIEGTDAYQRFILQLQAGMVKGWDATFIPIDFYKDYQPYQKKIDLLGMARSGVLQIHPEMIHPVERNVIGSSSILQVLAYNRKLLAEAKAPDTWEDFLKPEFKGKKFLADIRPFPMFCLVPLWGLDKTLDFAKKLAAQEPIWARGATRLLTAISAGEYSLFMGPNFNSVRRAEVRDKSGAMALKVVEPVPTRIARADGVLNGADNTHAAILWLEFHASPEAQDIMDKVSPYQASIFHPGSATARATQGKKLSVVDWNHFQRVREYEEKIIDALGFPRAQIKG